MSASFSSLIVPFCPSFDFLSVQAVSFKLVPASRQRRGFFYFLPWTVKQECFNCRGAPSTRESGETRCCTIWLCHDSKIRDDCRFKWFSGRVEWTLDRFNPFWMSLGWDSCDWTRSMFNMMEWNVKTFGYAVLNFKINNIWYVHKIREHLKSALPV